MLVFDVTVTVTVRNNVRRMRIKTAALLSTKAVRHTPTPWRLEPSPVREASRGVGGGRLPCVGARFSTLTTGRGRDGWAPEDEARIPGRTCAELALEKGAAEWARPLGEEVTWAVCRYKAAQVLMKRDVAGSVRHWEEKSSRDLQKTDQNGNPKASSTFLLCAHVGLFDERSTPVSAGCFCTDWETLGGESKQYALAVTLKHVPDENISQMKGSALDRVTQLFLCQP